VELLQEERSARLQVAPLAALLPPPHCAILPVLPAGMRDLGPRPAAGATGATCSRALFRLGLGVWRLLAPPCLASLPRPAPS
jgi:hypothetical protein